MGRTILPDFFNPVWAFLKPTWSLSKSGLSGGSRDVPKGGPGPEKTNSQGGLELAPRKIYLTRFPQLSIN